MKIVAIVPARGGSKRIPRKNIRLLGGRSLIAWTIEAAQQSETCAAVLASTDDPEIAAKALACGAVVLGLRPPHLATDEATSVDVVLQAIDEYEQRRGSIDGLLLLQPTSPFRTAMTVRRAVDLFVSHGGFRPVVSVSPARIHPEWCFHVAGDTMEPMLGWATLASRSQELEPAWVLNGAVYLITPARLREERTFLTRDVLPLKLEDPVEAIDIDTQADWEQAEAIVRSAPPNRTSGLASPGWLPTPDKGS